MPNAATPSADGGSTARQSSLPSPPLPQPPPATGQPAGPTADRGASQEATTRIYPFKSVQHPTTRARRDSAAYGASARTLSDVGSAGSSAKPKSLDPYLEEPTTGERVEVKDPDLASSATGETMSSDRAFLLSTRFEHQEGEDGEHLVITGRDGQIEKCEDEPIHAPGAVQAFGVLIAFERQDDGNLVVCQVSENSRHIIGIPPSALFRATSLANLLPKDEIDSLLDALDALDEREEDPDNTELAPIYFELSGFGLPGTDTSDPHSPARLAWDAYAALHRPSPEKRPKLYILELELIDDQVNPLQTIAEGEPDVDEEKEGLPYDVLVQPSQQDLVQSTVSLVKPLRALARIRNKRRGAGSATAREPNETDFVGLLSQVNEQLSRAHDLKTFAKLAAGVFKEITQVTRVMVYQFDEEWNGKVLSELVDYSKTSDLYLGLSFPASDIPAQARELYRINKVRLLYDRDQPTARMCCKNQKEVDEPLDMTHSLLRAMSPIHIKYLANMGVRSSMSVSLTVHEQLWGLVTLHTYGKYGHRVSFPTRQLCKLLGESVSRNIERISYANRLNARKLINTEATEANPSGFIVAKSEDLLALFDADFGVLSIGDEAKILGPVANSQDVLALLEYLRIKQYSETTSTQDIAQDWPDLEFPSQSQVIAGALVIPLSHEGKDFIVFLRRGQEQEVKWAGNPHSKPNSLEPRKSFKAFTEKVVGRSRAWTQEELETSGTLLLVYSKFIAVWREKQTAVAANQLNSILLANASHEVRTPLNAIVNYLELAMDGEISPEAREHISKSHEASRSLVAVINDLLDLTRTEQGQDLFLQDPFNLPNTLEESLAVHRREAERRGLTLDIVESPTGTPPVLLGDRAKVRVTLLKIVENALKHTQQGGILVEWGETMHGANFDDDAVVKADSIRISISITDTGCGIPESKLESIFREFEAVQQDGPESNAAVGLGLATVARIVRMLGGQLRIESKTEADEGTTGTKVTVILPFLLARDPTPSSTDITPSPAAVRPTAERRISSLGRRTSSGGSGGSEIESLIADMSSSLQGEGSAASSRQALRRASSRRSQASISSRSNADSKASGNPSSGAGSSTRQRASSASYPWGKATKIVDSDNEESRTPRPGHHDQPSTSACRNGDVKARDFEQEEHPREQGRKVSVGEHSSRPSDRAASTNGSLASTRSMTSDKQGALPTGLKILVVEDEAINATILERRLIKDGHTVTVAKHGGEAIRALEADASFDLILMDLNMPICDGYEASSTIRKDEPNYHFPSNQSRPVSHTLNNGIPIIAVTANSQERERKRLEDAGIDGWCLKPVRFARLQEIMSGIWDEEQRKRDLYKPGQWERGGFLSLRRPGAE